MPIHRQYAWPLTLTAFLLAVSVVIGAPRQAAAQTGDDALNAAGRLAERLNTAGPVTPSFMLNRTEREAIGAALEGVRAQALQELREMESAQPTPEPVSPEAPDIHLGGYIYVGDRAWSAWVNDRAITPDSNGLQPGTGEVAITGVSPTGVEVFWQVPGANDASRRVLRPNQTFLGRENRIVEGRVAAGEEEAAAAAGDGDVPSLTPARPPAAPQGRGPRQ